MTKERLPSIMTKINQIHTNITSPQPSQTPNTRHLPIFGAIFQLSWQWSRLVLFSFYERHCSLVLIELIPFVLPKKLFFQARCCAKALSISHKTTVKTAGHQVGLLTVWWTTCFVVTVLTSKQLCLLVHGRSYTILYQPDANSPNSQLFNDMSYGMFSCQKSRNPELQFLWARSELLPSRPLFLGMAQDPDADSNSDSNADSNADEVKHHDFSAYHTSRAPSLISTEIGDFKLPFYCRKLSNEEIEQSKQDALKCFELFKKTQKPKNKNKKETYVHIKVNFAAIEGRKKRRQPLDKPEKCLDCSKTTTNFHHLCDSCNQNKKKDKNNRCLTANCSHLRVPGTDTCIDCGRLQKKTLPRAIVNRIRSYVDKCSFKKCPWDFNLSKEKAVDTVCGDCLYCVICIHFDKSVETYETNGIERYCNGFGYEDWNVRPACRRCNVAKNDMTLEQFEYLIERIYKNSAHWLPSSSVRALN